MKDNDKQYRAEFLWPHEEESLEALGYEFANAETEPYRREIWNEIVSKIDIRLKTEEELRKLLIEVQEELESRYQSEDSPKGENVPGVRHR